ncbi:MAG: hypothetical protein V4820_19715 [Pseudomonadota bacterium]
MKNSSQQGDIIILDDRETNPLVVEVHPDSVVIVGPQGVSLALTPEAAIASAEVLLDAAEEAIET